MQKELKQMFGKILGEIYRTQAMMDLNDGVPMATIHGLLSGMENVIDEQLEHTGWVSAEEVKTITKFFAELDKNLATSGPITKVADLEAMALAAGISHDCFYKFITYHLYNHTLPESWSKMTGEIAEKRPNYRPEEN